MRTAFSPGGSPLLACTALLGLSAIVAPLSRFKMFFCPRLLRAAWVTHTRQSGWHLRHHLDKEAAGEENDGHCQLAVMRLEFDMDRAPPEERAYWARPAEAPPHVTMPISRLSWLIRYIGPPFGWSTGE